jgi:uncharacterized protein
MTLAIAKEAYDRKDFETANRMYAELANHGVAEALFWLGKLHYYGKGMHKDRSTAFQLFKRAANGGFTPAYWFLGHCYLDRQGTTENFVEGVRWMFLAAEAGANKADAEFYIGRCYARGEGVRRDHQKALEYFRSAAEGGNKDARFILAGIYERGYILKRDLSEARKWYNMAAINGHGRARHWMEKEHERVISETSKFIESSPASVKFYQDRCHAYIGLGNYDLASIALS